MKKFGHIIAFLVIMPIFFFLLQCPLPQVTLPPVAPAAPTLLAGDTQIDVSWTIVGGATAYNVFYNTTGITSVVTQSGGDIVGTSTTITSLTNGTLYYVWIKAKNSGGSSPFSPPSTATPQPAVPAAPGAPTLTPGSGQIGVGWAAVTGADTYNVFYNTTNNSGTSTQLPGDISGTSTTITSLSNGTLYYVWLKANNSAGSSAFSSLSSATTAPGVPGAPTLMPGYAQIVVNWSAVTGATSYNVFYNTAYNSGTATQFGGDIATTSTTITPVTGGTRYYVWLKAKNSAGTSGFSLSALTTPSLAGLPYEALSGGSTPDVSRFNNLHIYSIFAPQPAAKPESNSAPSTTYPYSFTTTSASGTPAVTAQEINYGTWTIGSISSGEVKWYFCNATSGAVHNINWDDSFIGSGTYTCDIKVSAYRENLTTAYFTNVDSGYTIPQTQTITAAATEKIFLKVQGYSVYNSGTYAIKDTPAGSPSIIPPPVVNNPPKKVSDDAVLDDRNYSPQGDQVYSSKQTNCDRIMRAAENQALASRVPQLSKKVSGVDAAAPYPISVGTTWDNVNILNTSSTWVTINTTCRSISTHAYFFVDNRNTAAMSSYLSSYGTTFDTIWTVNHAKFGSENDTDGNGKVIVIFSQELTGGLLGYFYAIDKFPKATYTYSNEGDIFYITTDTFYQGDIVYGTLAHEFQHMIYFDEHYNRGVTSSFSWLNEALSQAAEYYNSYISNHLAWIASFLSGGYAGLSLTNWTSNNYGYGAIYIRYLIDRFGDTAIKDMCSTDKVGVAAVEGATGTNFNTLFNDFTRALVMSGTGDSSDPKYNFTTLNLQTVQPGGRGGLTSSTSYTTPYVFSGSVYAYQILFRYWSGIFGTMSLSGTDVQGTGFGLSR